MQDSDTNKLRGRSAIKAAHDGITGEDEARLDSIISNLYKVNIDEAEEIHFNYHFDRILNSLLRRGSEKGIKSNILAERVQRLDISAAAYQVAKGKLIEAAAVDALFRAIGSVEYHSDKHDRYVNFYG